MEMASIAGDLHQAGCGIPRTGLLIEPISTPILHQPVRFHQQPEPGQLEIHGGNSPRKVPGRVTCKGMAKHVSSLGSDDGVCDSRGPMLCCLGELFELLNQIPPIQAIGGPYVGYPPYLL